LAHSWSEHKEFRFLLPILPMVCILCGATTQNIVSGVRPSRVRQIMLACALPNLIAITYLGLVHQRAPIEVNRAIRKAVVESKNPQPDTIHVHYLMSCHSTPLLSHLHIPRKKFPSTKIEPWYLDCSPECRKNLEVECESDAFLKHPDYFMKQTYCLSGNFNSTCSLTDKGSNVLRNVPDFIVCNAKHLQKMKIHLESMGMKEIGRFVNAIDSIEALGNSTYIEVLYDEIVLLRRL